jgi:hypothetical protein
LPPRDKFAGPTRSASYGRIWVGERQVQLMPALNEETIFSPEMSIANIDWGEVDKAVLLQGPFYGECNQYALNAVEPISRSADLCSLS